MHEQIREELEKIKQVVVPVGEKIIELSKPILSKDWKFKDSANFTLTDDSIVLVCSGDYPVAFITKLGRLEFASLSVTGSKTKQKISDILAEFEPMQIPTLGSEESIYFLKKDAKGEGVNIPDDNILRLSTPSSEEMLESILQARTELMKQIGCFKNLVQSKRHK